MSSASGTCCRRELVRIYAVKRYSSGLTRHPMRRQSSGLRNHGAKPRFLAFNSWHVTVTMLKVHGVGFRSDQVTLVDTLPRKRLKICDPTAHPRKTKTGSTQQKSSHHLLLRFLQSGYGYRIVQLRVNCCPSFEINKVMDIFETMKGTCALQFKYYDSSFWPSARLYIKIDGLQLIVFLSPNQT
jgi:hypothetical protein